MCVHSLNNLEYSHKENFSMFFFLGGGGGGGENIGDFTKLHNEKNQSGSYV